jgi:hypothetical protein
MKAISPGHLVSLLFNVIAWHCSQAFSWLFFFFTHLHLSEQKSYLYQVTFWQGPCRPQPCPCLPQNRQKSFSKFLL